MEGQQPGQTISPQPQSSEQHPVAQPSVHSAPPPPTQPAAPNPSAREPAAQWKFVGGNAAPQAVQVNTSEPDKDRPTRSTADSVSWTASEFIEHSKNFGWYVKLAIVAVILAALVFLVTRDKISTGVIIVAAAALGIFAARKPRVLQYRLDDDGLSVGTKLYNYELFKSFSMVNEGAVLSIYLLPMKRFMPALTIYYAHADEEAIVNVLSERLPVSERRSDAVDRLMHRIRF